ncbi:hypothetical protein DSCW_43330 [Desulfosarcina widdelii]|uniref:Uncharacterized protein n=1 Tax=Desulfosarcina widdelii TaxID=947919 RepID=A0A5K7Z569_9BACT|nr:hypothetical protein [Desulfosarcina widdelii]BBO76916.1 hypothetical protein DSCW_43330 [Desulfosarcina widdelii]
MNQIQWKSKAAVPHYRRLQDYQWIPAFLEAKRIKSIIRRVNEEKRALRFIPSSREDLLKRLKASFEAFQVRKISYLQQYILKNERSNDVFGRLEFDTDRFMKKLGPPITWADVEEAAENLKAYGNGLTDDERERRLEDIEAELASLSVQLEELSPAEYFEIQNGRIGADIREVFLAHWIGLQSKCNEPCGPQGFDLRSSPVDEADAYTKLGIGIAVNEHGDSPASR